MDRQRALDILKALADGIDPFTGELLPPTSPYQHVDAVRALVEASEALRASQQIGPATPKHDTKPRRPIDPTRPRIGKPWTPEEEKRLQAAFENRQSLDALARLHGRTRGGITSRLIKMGLIRPDTLEPVGSASADTGSAPADRRGEGAQPGDDAIPF